MMLARIIPAPLHRQLYRIADRARRAWWQVRKPQRRSVHVAAFDNRGRVLMVKHSYGKSAWTLPGGGMGRKENPQAAAFREFGEELGCPVNNLQLLDAESRLDSGSIDRRHVFVARLGGTPKPDMREIIAAELFDPAELPERASRWAIRQVRAAVELRADEPTSE